MVRKLALSLWLLLLVTALPPSVQAQSVSEADGAAFRAIISNQIAAFNADDGAKAWSYAAPSIQRMFPTPQIFMSMVKGGYHPVYRQKSFTFGEILTGNGQIMQQVTIVDAYGKMWTAIYSMEKQPDGTWRISGCRLAEIPGVST